MPPEKIAITLVGLGLFVLGFTPLFRGLSVGQLSWLALSTFLALVMWLPIGEIKAGDFSMKLRDTAELAQTTAAATAASQTELRELNKTLQLKLERQEAEIAIIRAESEDRAEAAQQARMELSAKTLQLNEAARDLSVAAKKSDQMDSLMRSAARPTFSYNAPAAPAAAMLAQ